jgi:hypothetical protein
MQTSLSTIIIIHATKNHYAEAVAKGGTVNLAANSSNAAAFWFTFSTSGCVGCSAANRLLRGEDERVDLLEHKAAHNSLKIRTSRAPQPPTALWLPTQQQPRMQPLPLSSPFAAVKTPLNLTSLP